MSEEKEGTKRILALLFRSSSRPVLWELFQLEVLESSGESAGTLVPGLALSQPVRPMHPLIHTRDFLPCLSLPVLSVGSFCASVCF